MRAFFRLSVIYFAVAMLVAAALGHLSPDHVAQGIAGTLEFVSRLSGAPPWMLLPAAAALVWVGRHQFSASIEDLLYGLGGIVFLQAAFSVMKVMIPEFVPFYADPWLADADRWLHGGIDPWRLAHRAFGGGDPHLASMLYFTIWTTMTILFPLFLAVGDPNRARAERFLILYAMVWIVVGNLMAVLGSSVGPVFVAQAYGSDAFAGLHAALDRSGLSDTMIGLTQDYLGWHLGTEDLAFASGVSAFPSVHVAMAGLIALYMGKRWPVMLPFAALLVAAVAFVSVLSGYHYAVDAYASILLVAVMWWLTRRYVATGDWRAAAHGPAAAAAAG
ncbi:MAG: phosphatase PAP2 family protein [Rhodobacteraceae bacterium]|nr:phosphatase PAP2 family protein [Paracoccaceae bacterium]